MIKLQAAETNESLLIRPWLMLVSRLVFFICVQALFASAFLLTGSSRAWEASADWWIFIVPVVNFIGLALLLQLFRSEGRRFWDIFRIHRKHGKSDLLAMLVVVVITGPVSYLPNIILGRWLFGDPQATLDLILRPLPYWAVYTGIFIFPITQGLVEIPTYFGYVMPRFEAQGMRPWMAVTLPALFLGLQHLAIPLLFDVRFITWRALMYIPFAFLVGIVLHWRPRLMPYIVIGHVLIDMAFAVMFLGAAY